MCLSPWRLGCVLHQWLCLPIGKIGPVFWSMIYSRYFVLGMFPQLYVFKVPTHLFVNYSHFPVKDKFERVQLSWCLLRGNKFNCVWARALYGGISGHWYWWGLMQACTPGNGFRHVWLLGVVCFHPWIWCLHPWSWRLYHWKVHPWRLQRRRRLVQPWRRWCWGYASIFCREYVSVASFSAVPKFWFG